MASTAILSVKIISDAKNAAAGMDSTSSKLGKMGKVAGIAGAALAAGAAVGAKALWDATQSAANLEQSIGAIDTVFGKSAGKMHTWAKGAASDVGLTRNEFNELGTLIGSQLKNGGTAMDQLAPKTRNLIKTGADLSSMFGGTTREAVEALSSALKGERDPIEKYGVTLNQAKIDAEAASLGFKKVDGALSSQAQQAATLSLISKQTADAQGNFAKESGTLAHQQQVLGAEFGNLKDTIGTAFLPILTAAFTWLNANAVPALKNLVAGLGSAGGASGILSGAFAAVQPILAAVVAGFRTLYPPIRQLVVGSIIPLGQTIAGVLVPILVRVYSTVIPAVVAMFRKIIPAIGPVVNAVRGLVAAIGARLVPVVNFLLPVVAKVFRALGPIVAGAMRTIAAVIRTVTAIIRGDWGKVWSGIKSILSNAWGTIKAIVKGALGVVKSIMGAAWGAIRNAAGDAWAKVVSTLKDAWGKARGAVSDGVGKVVGLVKDLPGKITGALSGLPGQLLDIGRDVIAGLVDGIQGGIDRVEGAVRALAGAIPGPIKKLLGISSPSKVFRQIGLDTGAGLVEGLKASRRAAERATRDLIKVPEAPTITPRYAAPGTSSRSLARGAAPVVNINFNGLVTDPQGTARQIEKLLTDHRILVGAPS